MSSSRSLPPAPTGYRLRSPCTDHEQHHELHTRGTTAVGRGIESVTSPGRWAHRHPGGDRGLRSGGQHSFHHTRQRKTTPEAGEITC